MTTILQYKPQPVELAFEVTNNKHLLPYVKKAFLATVILSKEDMRRGYIEINSTKYSMYVTEEVKNLLCDATNSYRLTTIASFQMHINDATVVLCKLMEKGFNKRYQEYYKAECANKALSTLKELFK